MKCFKCKKNKAVVDLFYIKNLCKSCFFKIIERRLRKHIRLNKLFKKNDRILIIDNLSFYLVKKIIKDLPVKIFFKEIPVNSLNNKKIKDYIRNNKINRIVIPWTLDDEISLFLENIFLNKKTRIKKDYIKLLKTVTDKEIILFARLKNIKFRENKKNKEIKEFLDKLEYKHPETKFSLLRSINQLEKL